MHVERHAPSPLLSPFLLGAVEGWELVGGSRAQLREVPFPGVPLIFGLEAAWEIEGPLGTQVEHSFLAGLHEAPSLVRPAARSWSCVELRLTPVAAHRLFGLPMHELANRAVALATSPQKRMSSSSGCARRRGSIASR